jgi:hypothetical protein
MVRTYICASYVYQISEEKKFGHGKLIIEKLCRPSNQMLFIHVVKGP